MRAVVAGLLRNAELAPAASRTPAAHAAAAPERQGESPVDGLPEDDLSDLEPVDLDALIGSEVPRLLHIVSFP